MRLLVRSTETVKTQLLVRNKIYDKNANLGAGWLEYRPDHMCQNWVFVTLVKCQLVIHMKCLPALCRVAGVGWGGVWGGGGSCL